MSIRPATVADIPVVMAIERHAATAAHWSAEQYEAAFAGESPSRLVLLVEDEGGVRGFIVGRVLGKDWEIENITVAAPARGRGFGARLLAEFLELAQSQGAENIFLEVRESNHEARRLYEKSNFVESGRRRLYYREPGEDAIVYQLGFT